MKGQAISPPHNYPVLKQESGIDWPGSVLGDWTCQSLALPGRASPCKLDTQRIYEMCAKGLGFLPQSWDLPVKPRHHLVLPGVGRRGACGWVLGRSPVGSADGRCSWRRRGDWVAPPLVIRHPPDPRSTSLPLRSGARAVVLIVPCKFAGLPGAEPRNGVPAAAGAAPSPPSSAETSRGTAPRHPRQRGADLLAVHSRCQRSSGRSERWKVPSCLSRSETCSVLGGEHQSHRNPGECLEHESVWSLRV